MRESLEEKTGLSLIDLPMNEWRHNTPLRKAVTLQIELMHPSDFKDVKMAFDGRIRHLQAYIKETM